MALRVREAQRIRTIEMTFENWCIDSVKRLQAIEHALKIQRTYWARNPSLIRFSALKDYVVKYNRMKELQKNTLRPGSTMGPR